MSRRKKVAYIAVSVIALCCVGSVLLFNNVAENPKQITVKKVALASEVKKVALDRRLKTKKADVQNQKVNVSQPKLSTDLFFGRVFKFFKRKARRFVRRGIRKAKRYAWRKAKSLARRGYRRFRRYTYRAISRKARWLRGSLKRKLINKVKYELKRRGSAFLNQQTKKIFNRMNSMFTSGEKTIQKGLCSDAAQVDQVKEDAIVDQPIDLRSSQPWKKEGAYVRITNTRTGYSVTNKWGRWREGNRFRMWTTNNTYAQIFRVWRGVYASRRYRSRKWFTLRPINSNGQFSERLYVGFNPRGNPKNRSGHFISLQKRRFWLWYNRRHKRLMSYRKNMPKNRVYPSFYGKRNVCLDTHGNSTNKGGWIFWNTCGRVGWWDSFNIVEVKLQNIREYARKLAGQCVKSTKGREQLLNKMCSRYRLMYPEES